MFYRPQSLSLLYPLYPNEELQDTDEQTETLYFCHILWFYRLVRTQYPLEKEISSL